MYLKEKFKFIVSIDSSISSKNYLKELKKKIFLKYQYENKKIRFKLISLDVNKNRRISETLEEYIQEGFVTFFSCILKLGEIYYGKIEKILNYGIWVQFSFFRGFVKHMDIFNKKFTVDLEREVIFVENKIFLTKNNFVKGKIISLNYKNNFHYCSLKQKGLGKILL